MIHTGSLDLFAGIAIVGHARHTLLVDDLDAVVALIADRGLKPAQRETCSNGVRKTTYRDLDGNGIRFGGGPL